MAKSVIYLLCSKKNQHGEFEIDHYEDAGLDKSAISARGAWNYVFLSTAWSTARVYWCNEHTAVTTPYGIFWFFDSKGRMKRRHSLYKLYDEDCLKYKKLWPGAVLGCQPNSVGGLLVSALSEDAIIVATNEENSVCESIRHDWPTQAAREAYDLKVAKMFVKILAVEPSVDWFNVDPQGQQIYPTAPPRGIPSIIRKHSEYQDFNWLFNARGNIDIFTEQKWRNDVDLFNKKVNVK